MRYDPCSTGKSPRYVRLAEMTVMPASRSRTSWWPPISVRSRTQRWSTAGRWRVRSTALLHVLHVVDTSAALFSYADASLAGTAPPELQGDSSGQRARSLEAFVPDRSARAARHRRLRVSNSTAKEIADSPGRRASTSPSSAQRGADRSIRMLMGSVADKVIRRAPCPVLAVRHPEHEFVIPDALHVMTHAKA